MDWLWYCLSGLLAGVLSGMGMGGGTVLIPMLTLVLGVSQHGAQGANMLAFLPGAAVALLVHRRDGRLALRAAAPLLVTGALGAVAGALAATYISAHWLRRAFGAGLCLVAILTWRTGERKEK